MVVASDRAAVQVRELAVLDLAAAVRGLWPWRSPELFSPSVLSALAMANEPVEVVRQSAQGQIAFNQDLSILRGLKFSPTGYCHSHEFEEFAIGYDGGVVVHEYLTRRHPYGSNTRNK